MVRHGGRFTLLEMMIVVAIVMVLAALAIPAVYSMQLRAKRSELFVNMDGLGTALVAYAMSNDQLILGGATNPAIDPGKQAVDWDPAPPEFGYVGWRPDGKVRGTYTLTLITLVNPQIWGTIDVDGDNEELTVGQEWLPTTLEPQLATGYCSSGAACDGAPQSCPCY